MMKIQFSHSIKVYHCLLLFVLDRCRMMMIEGDSIERVPADVITLPGDDYDAFRMCFFNDDSCFFPLTGLLATGLLLRIPIG